MPESLLSFPTEEQAILKLNGPSLASLCKACGHASLSQVQPLSLPHVRPLPLPQPLAQVLWHPDPGDQRCVSEVVLVSKDPEMARRFPKELYIINAASIRKHLYAKMTLAPADEKVIIGKSLTNVSGM